MSGDIAARRFPEPGSTITIPPEPAAGTRPWQAPWWLRILGKLVLSRVPLPYPWWRRLGMFRHGLLAGDAERRGASFLAHFEAYKQRHATAPRRIVEIGPGDSIAVALWARTLNVETTWLIDIGRFAVDDPEHYRAACAAIAKRGWSPPALSPPGGLDAVLDATGAVYRTDGLAALGSLAEGAVDLLFSQAVLEHIPLPQLRDLMRESYRVLRPGGLCSHGIDLRDHLGGALNHLRLPGWLWEHPLVARSGFYTNRLRPGEFCRLAEEAGFVVTIPQLVRWSELPTPRRALDRCFRDLPEAELSAVAFTLLLYKPETAGA